MDLLNCDSPSLHVLRYQLLALGKSTDRSSCLVDRIGVTDSDHEEDPGVSFLHAQNVITTSISGLLFCLLFFNNLMALNTAFCWVQSWLENIAPRMRDTVSKFIHGSLYNSHSNEIGTRFRQFGHKITIRSLAKLFEPPIKCVDLSNQWVFGLIDNVNSPFQQFIIRSVISLWYCSRSNEIRCESSLLQLPWILARPF